MVVSLSQIQLGVVEFIEKEIAAKAVGLQKFLYYGASFLVANNVEQIFHTLVENPMVKATGILDENNNIDLDKLYQIAKYAIQKSGKVTVGGVILGESDVEKLYTTIKSMS